MSSERAARKPLIGFLGLGSMGGAMARNLLEAGRRVVGYDPVEERLAACVAEGAEPGADEPDVVGRADLVMTSLHLSAQFEQVAEAHLLPNARPGQVFIDLGTTEPALTRRLAAAFAEAGACLLDAPVSGGPGGAEAGTLRIFVGGDESVAAHYRSLLEVLGDPSRIVYCGPSGSGQVVKGVNQLAMGLSDAVLVEAIAFGVLGGVDPAAIRMAVGGHEGWRARFDRIASRVVGGTVDGVVFHWPELPYWLAEAQERGFEIPMARAVHQFTREGEATEADSMGRPFVPFWGKLMARGGAE